MTHPRHLIELCNPLWRVRSCSPGSKNPVQDCRSTLRFVADEVSLEDQLAAELKAALDAHDLDRAKALLAGVTSSANQVGKSKVDEYLWDIWRRVGAVKPPDLPPFSRGTATSTSIGHKPW